MYNLNKYQITRFMSSFQLSANGCWNWIQSKDSSGYGKFFIKTYYGAHRVAFSLLRGSIPTGMCIDHLCRNRSCVNPFHMEVVTAHENQQRGLTAKTHCVNGHPYIEKNIYISPTKKHRRCKLCHAINNRRLYELKCNLAFNKPN